VKVEIDTHGFTAFLNDLARLSGKSFTDVLIDQAGTVLDLCIKRSPDPFKDAKGGREGLRKKVAMRILKPGRYVDAGGTVLENGRVPRPLATGTLQTLTGTRGGQAGREWYIGTNPKGKRIILPQERLIGNAKFRQRQAGKMSIYHALEPEVQPAIDRIGSLAASWVSIADQIGAPLRRAPKWVQKVRRDIEDGEDSKVVISDVGAFVELVNTNKSLINRNDRYNGASILYGAVETRMKAFASDLSRGVFEDLKTRAQRYPGLFVAPDNG
jgi:hypothetical protein